MSRDVFDCPFTRERAISLRRLGRTGVQLPSPPAFAFEAERKSEGCHAGVKRRRAIELYLRASKDYGLAGVFPIIAHLI
jgi:hypothetical protein